MESIKPCRFYSEKDKFALTTLEQADKNAALLEKFDNRMPDNLLGPSKRWEQFRKQADALEAAAKLSKNETFATFVNQNKDGYRDFIVAHPEVYWWYLMRKKPEDRCSYEVIPEDYPCWLYFDLEFKLDLNPRHDGPKMTQTVISIFSAYIEKYWGLSWDEKNVVNLDSTTSMKFSRHLIFCMPGVAWRNNFHVGSLVKGVCHEIDEYVQNSSALHGILSCYELKELEELYVETGKGKKIFIDTAVYSRNRHFRLYKSTKSGKFSHLEVAPDSKHVPIQQNLKDKELAIFLDSLISYFPDKKDLLLLEIFDNVLACSKSYRKSPSQSSQRYNSSNNSRYPELDKFILSLVKPGKIRVCKYLENRKHIIYEIIENRYCANIGRQHKSNNIFWVVDLNTKKVYQRCHDEDCANFVSARLDIPLEVQFYMDDDNDRLILEAAENQIDEEIIDETKNLDGLPSE